MALGNQAAALEGLGRASEAVEKLTGKQNARQLRKFILNTVQKIEDDKKKAKK